MLIELEDSEVDLLVRLLDAAGRERRNPEGRGTIADRAVRDPGRLEALRARLAPRTREAQREQIVDESVEETFPASDPPARSAARLKEDRPPA